MPRIKKRKLVGNIIQTEQGTYTGWPPEHLRERDGIKSREYCWYQDILGLDWVLLCKEDCFGLIPDLVPTQPPPHDLCPISYKTPICLHNIIDI